MVLTPLDRGILEKFVDNMIKEAPNEVKFFRIPKVKSALQIQQEEDFVFGMTYGKILQYYNDYYKLAHFKLPSDKEIEEIMEVIFNRIKEVKEAIFKAG